MKTVVGNLLDIQSGTILHQVNCMGVAGGLAGALHDKWPVAFVPYFKQCRANADSALGSFVIGEAAPGLLIGHVFGQWQPGPNTDMIAVHESLRDAIQVVTGPVFSPWCMGCGIGGGRWPEYVEALEAWFPDITIVRRPEDGPRL